jgi:hypothetical protein
MFQNLVWEEGGVAEVSKVEGRVAQTTNIVLGGTGSEDTPDEWNIIGQNVSFFHSSTNCKPTSLLSDIKTLCVGSFLLACKVMFTSIMILETNYMNTR